MDRELAFIQQFYMKTIDFLANYSFQIIGAIIIVLIGWFLSKYVYTVLVRFFQTHDFDPTLGKFAANGVRLLIFGAMIVVAIGKLGISIAPFVAAVGAVFLTAGLAIQGSVANYAAGISLIITRPFRVGDTILVNNVYGEVEEIKLAYTTLRTEDEELITVPNKNMIGEVLVNSSNYRIVESKVGISYANDAEIIGIRYWVPTRNFFKFQYEVNLLIYKALQNASITIPFPQREIRLLNGTKDA